ncbi:MULTISPECIES: LysR substrate-binding domain-containing protein [unclassified Sphingomonas]|uniref:LysR substrate-binding domain-containing protein n=1 Tax=unclassified Sphingomonas TaxID=196159 RepID=UPI0006FC2AC3|nr:MULTISPECIES: LysR substrate-binding domain-containing protein [unclassified Sphingomonas]KQX20162.1 LysR family transcriptional regulator [Sphingomonas sp. Root1294]KQY67412.1 LysR family transcriptional regulator [Sphingomonas sp. Root50]KRB90789.1 LysR family transcriptional regulator [Sphingomonas sp. Root720]
MARQIPPLSGVRVFEAAARHLNFTRAAEELAMTQAAVSYQIRMIEDRLGTPLFLRTGRRVSLSPAGQRLAPLVTAAFDQLDQAFAKVRFAESGVLTISAAPGIAASWLGPRLARFQLAKPDIAVRLLATHELVDFARDEVDVGIRIGQGQWPGLRAIRMFPAEFTPMCSPAYIERKGPFADPAQLFGALRMNSDDVWWRAWFAQIGVPVPDDIDRNAIHVDSQVIEGMAAVAGEGVAMLTPRFWPYELETGRLVQIFPHVGDGGSFWLVYPEHKHGSAKVKAFREWLMAEVRAG